MEKRTKFRVRNSRTLMKFSMLFSADIPCLVHGSGVLEWIKHALSQSYQAFRIETPEKYR